MSCRRNYASRFAAGLLAMSALFLAGCGESKGDPKAEAPPAAQVERAQDANLVTVDHPEQFPLFTAIPHEATSQLVATGVVNPDVSRTVPVISLASGRVMEIDARLGDTVKKGQVLLRVQSADISSAFSDYKKAVADEVLARAQYERAKDLYEKGAFSLNDYQKLSRMCTRRFNCRAAITSIGPANMRAKNGPKRACW